MGKMAKIGKMGKMRKMGRSAKIPKNAKNEENGENAKNGENWGFYPNTPKMGFPRSRLTITPQAQCEIFF